MFTNDRTIRLTGTLLLACILIVGCDTVESVESPRISSIAVIQGESTHTSSFSVSAGFSLSFEIDASDADKCVMWPGDGDPARTPDNYPEATAVNLPETDEGNVFRADYTYDAAGSYAIIAVCTSWNYGATESNDMRRQAEITVN